MFVMPLAGGTKFAGYGYGILAIITRSADGPTRSDFFGSKYLADPVDDVAGHRP
jgi:hypothetical protein